MSIKTYTIQEFRKFKNKKAINRKPRKAGRSKKYQPINLKKSLLYSSSKIVLGFDADVDKCGIAAYDVEERTVLVFCSMPYNDLATKLDVLLEVTKKPLYARVEIADDSAIYGKVKGRLGSKDKTQQKIAFQTMVGSGRSRELSNQFAKLLDERHIPCAQQPDRD